MIHRTTRTFASAIAVAALGLGTLGCGDDVEGPDETVFEAVLSGASEVPPVQTSASGTARFVLSDGTVSYGIEVVSLANAFAAHIHSGEPGENGPILVTLFTADPPVSIDDNVLVEGEFTGADVEEGTFDELLELMESGGAYVNAHTTANPDGEIRGQVMPASEP